MQSFACLARKNKKKRSGSLIFSGRVFLFLAIPLLFIADRLSKNWFLTHFSEGQSYPLIEGVLHWTRVSNTGAAFGLMKGATSVLIYLTSFSILTLSAYLLIRWRQITPISRTGWSLIIGGALGNLYDRIFLGYVVDFIDFRIWPVFNFADTAVCTGVGLVLLGALKR